MQHVAANVGGYTPGVSAARVHPIRLLREQRRWSLDDLASRSGVHRQSIYRIEIGEVKARAGTLQKLAAAFGVSIADLDASRPKEAPRATAAIGGGVGGNPRVEDLLSGLIEHVKGLEGQARAQFIRAVTALLAALDAPGGTAAHRSGTHDGR